jgi:signal transduction histidine kinase
MLSVPLSDLHRTTSFRLGLLFLTLFAAASLIVCGFIYWQTAGYLTRTVDEWLQRELTGLATANRGDIVRILNERGQRDAEGQRPFALLAADGGLVAGSPVQLPSPLPAIDRPFDFTLPRAGRQVPFRGMTRQITSGEILLVAQDMRVVNEIHEVVLGAMGSGGVLVLVLGLAGAVLTGVGALRQIDRVTRAIESIVRGNLSERLPVGRSAGDLDRLIHVVNGMLEDIERLMHEVKGVTDDIAHDLRTPLTRLLAGLERARRRATSVEDYAAAVDEATEDIKGILATFAALLRISEVEDGARRGAFTTVDLARVAADVAELYEPVAEEKGVGFRLDLDPAAPAELAGDPSLLFDAIGNLVDNAIKFTPAGGCVIVRVFREGRDLGISVTDSGPGIPAEERETVLRRFYRSERSRHTPGSGLGLSLVAAVARLHELGLVIEDAHPGCRVELRYQGKSKGILLAPAATAVSQTTASTT